MLPAENFNKVVDWLHGEIVHTKQAPGLLIGLSGTDSIVAFLAAYKALDLAGKANRLMGVHFAPSEDFLADYPEAEKHTWFSTQIIPWLRQQAPLATIVVDTTIDWRYDGLRWGMLADMSVITMPERKMRTSEDKYWLVGTRNRTENELYNYSVASTIASVQPIIKLWKSDIMDICQYLKVPELVINKACEADCFCGREELRAQFGRELDWVLDAQLRNDLSDTKYMSLNVNLKQKLNRYIRNRYEQGAFKTRIPYEP